MSRVVKYMNKKVEYNLYYLVCFLVEAIGLRMISYAITKLDPKLIKQYSLKLIKELWVTVSNQLSK